MVFCWIIFNFFSKAMKHFGEHLMLDGYRGDFEKLNDDKLILQCLNELPDLLGMHKLTESVIYEAPDNRKRDPGGWSGFVVIAESHISIHTFPKNGFVTIDAYTCKNCLDKNFIVEYFSKKFDLKETEVNFVERGKKYHRFVRNNV